MDHTNLYINGTWRDGSDGARFDVINPADETVLASVAFRNQDRPQVRRLVWEYDGPTCTVEYELWNPQDQPVYTRTLTRMATLSDVRIS